MVDTPDAARGMDSGGAGMDSGGEPAHDASPADATAMTDSSPAQDAATDAAVLPDPPATQVSDYCQSIPMLQRQPVIDGVVDSALNLVPLTPVGWRSSSGLGLPDHTTASFALAWRPNGLYAYVHVVDPNRRPAQSERIWEGDGVEVYFDNDGLFPDAPRYDNPGTVQVIVAAPENDSTPSTRATRFRDGERIGAWMSPRFAAFPTADGYTLEALLQPDAIDGTGLGLQVDGTVGIDLSVNVSALDAQLDADAGLKLEGNRLGQYFLRVTEPTDCGGVPFCNTGAFCTPTLVR